MFEFILGILAMLVIDSVLLYQVFYHKGWNKGFDDCKRIEDKYR